MWNSNDWREAAAEWIDQACSAYSISRVGGPDFWPAELHQVSAIVQTDAADLIFSVTAPGLASVAAATVKAGELVPDKVVMPLAIDRTAGYMLSPDFGHTLADLGDSVENWELALSSLGSFQVALIGHEEDFFDAGVTVVDPQFLPEQFEQALMLHVSLEPSHPLYLDPSRADSLVINIDRLNAAAQTLHAGAVPLSLEHGAFDLSQVVVPADAGVHGRILNLGSAHWAHPFSSLAVPLAAMCHAWDCTAHDERVMRVLAAYLNEFSAYGTPDELYDLIDAAVFVAPLSQHETWLRLLLDASDEHLSANAQLVLNTLSLG